MLFNRSIGIGQVKLMQLFRKSVQICVRNPRITLETYILLQNPDDFAGP